MVAIDIDTVYVFANMKAGSSLSFVIPQKKQLQDNANMCCRVDLTFRRLLLK